MQLINRLLSIRHIGSKKKWESKTSASGHPLPKTSYWICQDFCFTRAKNFHHKGTIFLHFMQIWHIGFQLRGQKIESRPVCFTFHPGSAKISFSHGQKHFPLVAAIFPGRLINGLPMSIPHASFMINCEEIGPFVAPAFARQISCEIVSKTGCEMSFSAKTEQGRLSASRSHLK